MRHGSALLGGCLLLITATAAAQTPLGSEWTFQGLLEQGGAGVDNTADFLFTLWDAEVGGNQIGGPVSVDNVTVSDGLFSVGLDFGAESFDGDKRYLQIAVRSPHDPGDTQPLTTLNPRQPLTAHPYALQTRGLFVDDAGNVGFGTTSPNAPLDVRGSMGGQTVRFSGEDGNYRFLQELDGSDLASWTFRNNTGSTAVKITTGGDVGIGTTTPIADLHVRGDSALGELIVTPGTSDSSAQIRMTENVSAGLGAIMRYDGTANQWQVIGKNSNGETGPHVVVERDDGRVGIGTTTPTSPLSIVGDVTVLDGSGVETVRLDPQTGGTGGGAVLVRDEFGVTTVEIEGSEGVGGGSFIKMWNSEAVQAVEIDADEATGAAVRLRNNADHTTIELLSDLGGEGRIICDVVQINGGSDLSEQFDVSFPESTVQPGMLVSIDPENAGKLTVSRQAYDRRVAGVISGAGGVKPGMLMGQKGTIADGQYPVALTGRVWCHVDARFGQVEPGDQLTTSTTPGHAMKVGDHDKARGAVIGKAMTGLQGGRGLVLVLVQPQ